MSKAIDLRKLVERLHLKTTKGEEMRLYESQWAVLSSVARIVVVAGNSRWGKSLLAGILGTAYMHIPDARVWIVAPNYPLGEKEFRYIYTFMNENLGLRESIVSQHYDVRSGNMDIKTAIGSVLEVKSADNPISLLGEELDFLILSEGANLPDFIWERYLRARLINRKGRVFIPSTPAGDGGFVHKFFLKGLDQAQEQIRSFQFTCYDCPHISPEEIADAKSSLSQEAFDEQFLGKFVSYKGLVYKEFDLNKHIVDDFVIPDYWERYRAIDYGVSNPFVCLWFAVAPDGSVYIYNEHYQAGMSISAHAKEIHRLTGKDRITLNYIDPSAGIKLDLCELSIPCIDAENDVMPGIDRVHGYLAIDKLLHKPKLQVFRSCNHTISEFVTYVYPERKDGQNSKENPIKQNDHAMDAMRYFITSRPKAYEKPANAPAGSVEWWLNNLDSNRVDPNVIGNQ